MKTPHVNNRSVIIGGKKFLKSVLPESVLSEAEDEGMVNESLKAGHGVFIEENIEKFGHAPSEKTTYLIELRDLSAVIDKNDSVRVDERKWFSHEFKIFRPKRNFTVRLNEYPEGKGGIKFYLGNLADTLEEFQLAGVIHYLNGKLASAGSNLKINTVHDKRSMRHGEFAFETDSGTFEEDKSKLISVLEELKYRNDEGGKPFFEKRRK